jgi:hypothetical protein
MAASTLPVAKASLVALIQGLPDLVGVTVSYGDPGIAKLELEHVFLSGTKQDTYSWAPFGQLKRDEQYTLKFYVHVAKRGLTQQEATERCMALFSAIEAGIRPKARTSTDLAPGVYEVAVYPEQLTEYVLEDGYAAFMDADIEIKARF